MSGRDGWVKCEMAVVEELRIGKREMLINIGKRTYFPI
jgi:hypothetical protein